jgi:hypothetical protein
VVCATAAKQKAITTTGTRPALFMPASLSSQQNGPKDYLRPGNSV